MGLEVSLVPRGELVALHPSADVAESVSIAPAAPIRQLTVVPKSVGQDAMAKCAACGAGERVVVWS